MTDYVSKEELEEFFEGITITVAGRTRAEAIRDVLKAVYNGIMKLPTVDAVPVIRCKDCKYYQHGKNADDWLWCMMNHHYTDEEKYCAWAERKEE